MKVELLIKGLNKLVAQNRYTRALSLINKTKIVNPTLKEQATLNYLKICCHFKLNQYESAFKSIKLLNVEPIQLNELDSGTRSHLQYMLGICLIAQNKIDKGLSELEDLIAHEKNELTMTLRATLMVAQTYLMRSESFSAVPNDHLHALNTLKRVSDFELSESNTLRIQYLLLLGMTTKEPDVLEQAIELMNIHKESVSDKQLAAEGLARYIEFKINAHEVYSKVNLALSLLREFTQTFTHMTQLDYYQKILSFEARLSERDETIEPDTTDAFLTIAYPARTKSPMASDYGTLDSPYGGRRSPSIF